jgi:hypothetical protein
MTIAEIITKIEQAITELDVRPPGIGFLKLPEDAEQYAYRRGARDAYQIVVEALKELQND